MESFDMNAIWKWKRWDVRADGKIFWGYNKKRSCEVWIDWDKAIKEQKSRRIAGRERAKEKAGELKEYQKQYRERNKERVAFHKWSHYLKNKKDYIERQKTWIANNKERYRQRMQKYTARKIDEDPMFAMKRRLRSRMSYALSEKGYTKKSNTHSLLGCEWIHFIKHIESMFCEGMTWGNKKMWHVDHVIPLVSAKNEEELIKLFHYTNTRPLWAFDNLSKGSKIL